MTCRADGEEEGQFLRSAAAGHIRHFDGMTVDKCPSSEKLGPPKKLGPPHLLKGCRSVLKARQGPVKVQPAIVQLTLANPGFSPAVACPQHLRVSFAYMIPPLGDLGVRGLA